MPVPAPWRHDEVGLRLHGTIGGYSTEPKLRRSPLTRMTTNLTRLSPLRHQAWIEIDLAALAHNARVLRRAIPAGARLGILVKANGYGHGLEMAARAALTGGADQLIVAALNEGLALRRAGIDAPVLVVYPIPVVAVAQAAEARLELSIGGSEGLRRLLAAWADRAAGSPAGLHLHVEVDSGMGRGGIAPGGLVEAVRLIDAAPGTTLAGIWSHLADGSDASVSGEQTKRFETALAEVAATRRALPARHLVATEAIFRGTAPAYDMVRVGLGYYGELGLGVEPSAEMATLAAALRPAMAVKALPVRLEPMPAGAAVGYGGEWVAARPSLIATLPIGYADGWVRAYWPGAEALVRGQRIPLVGRVSMDSVCADVTDVAGVTLDDEFVLLGAQGDERISPSELARRRKTIINEIFCSFGARLPRVYVDEGA
jgi:alanine racemase